MLVGLAVAAVLVGGSLATRGGPLGGRGAQRDERARTTTANQAPALSLPTLGSVSDQLARLPSVTPGELAGVLGVTARDCSPDQIDLGTLERLAAATDICAAPGAKFGIRDGELSDGQVDVVDLNGRPVETVPVPRGWFIYGLTRQGIALCDDDGDAHGWLHRFLGSTVRLPSCPRGQTRDGRLLFVSADRRSLIDERGRRVLTVAGRLPRVPDIQPIGDRLLAVDTELYRDGRQIASYGKGGLSVLGASGDGSVALLQRDETGDLVVYRGGVMHAVRKELTGDAGTGVVAPDGERILLQRDGGVSIVIDAATRRPLARLELRAGEYVYEWRPAGQ